MLQSDSWPKKGVEKIHSCPVCESHIRRVLYTLLADRVFYCAPGEWTLYQCTDCGSGYLDPRPTRETIHLAYKSYYTHAQPTATPRSHGTISRLRQALTNGYLNWRFDINLRPTTRFGIFVAWIYPGLRNALDRRYRNLPKAQTRAYLLDVGFGNGSFLKLAQKAGWKVTGADPDLVTFKKMRRRGFNVRLGGIESFDGMMNCFDIITLNHVIEHVHNPRLVIRKAYKLLKQGGHLWMETPNIDSFGHRYFKSYWRGLEPPRHLVIFNWNSLEILLQQEGFRVEHHFPQTNAFSDLSAKSKAIRSHTDPYQSKITFKDKLLGLFARFLTKSDRRYSEFVTILAVKPKANCED